MRGRSGLAAPRIPDRRETTPMDDATPPQPPPGAETDERFPSGPWTGFFLQPVLAGRHWMELHLTFKDGQVRGEGRDWVGSFLVTGRYETDTGKCWWSKKYVGRHDVAYMGYNEGRGIWGTWELADPPWKGGFHIWPEGMNVDGRTRSAEEDVPLVGTADVSWSAESLEAELVTVGSSEMAEDDGPSPDASWN
jgi:hypothetical protein